MPLRPYLRFFFAALLLAPAVCCAQQIAFTWDDLPAHSSLPAGETRIEIANKLLKAMQQEKMPPAYGFINGIRLEQEPKSAAVLDVWRAAGYPLGNHTWSHMNLNEHRPAEFEVDIEKNEPILKSKMGGQEWRWLRYPYLAEGDTPAKRKEVRAYLAQKGYHVASVTMSFGDYAWNEPYARCLARHDEAGIQSLETSYLASAKDSAGYVRAMAKQLYGHDIPYVLLMHVGAMDARMLPRLLALYRQLGFSFIPLEQAEHDPFYASDLDPAAESGPTTLEGAMYARHLTPPRRPAPPELGQLCR